MRRNTVLATGIAAVATLIVSLAACSSSNIDESAAMATYDAVYSGPGTMQRSAGGYAAGAVQPATVTLTLNQFGTSLTGTMTTSLGAGLPTYTGGVMGHLNDTGADLTYVQSPCTGTLYGAFTLTTDGTLTGSLTGRDCDAGPTGSNVRIAFTNLATH